MFTNIRPAGNNNLETNTRANLGSASVTVKKRFYNDDSRRSSAVESPTEPTALRSHPQEVAKPRGFDRNLEVKLSGATTFTRKTFSPEWCFKS